SGRRADGAGDPAPHRAAFASESQTRNPVGATETHWYRLRAADRDRARRRTRPRRQLRRPLRRRPDPRPARPAHRPGGPTAMIDNLISYFGFSRMPFGRDLAPGMLHRHTAHNEAVARIGWCIAE